MQELEVTDTGDIRLIKFSVYGTPFGKQRPKFARKGKFTIAYTQEETVLHEEKVKVCFLDIAKGKKFTQKQPLDIRIIAYYPIPKRVSKKRLNEMLEYRMRPVVKPDLDNVAKLICDALNGLAWHDDNAIVDMQVRKFYSTQPRVEVIIKAI